MFRFVANPAQKSAIIYDLSFEQAAHILRACEHEMIRSTRRSTDDRLGEDARQKEAASAQVLREICNVLAISRALIE